MVHTSASSVNQNTSTLVNPPSGPGSQSLNTVIVGNRPSVSDPNEYPIQVDGAETLYLLGSVADDLLVNESTIRSVDYGRQGDDWMLGGKAADVIFGGLGSDKLFGRDGDDFLFPDEEYNPATGTFVRTPPANMPNNDRDFYNGAPDRTAPWRFRSIRKAC